MTDGLLSGLRKVVEKTADEFEPGLLSVFTVEAAIEHWGAIERVAHAAKLRAAARADDIGLDADQAVAQSSRIPTGQARRQNKTAKKVRRHKKTADAFAKGNLSAAQANAIADAVDADPDAEDDLLGLAANTSATDLLKECERVRRTALDADGTLHSRQQAMRSLRWWTDAYGMLCFTGKLPPLAGAKFVAEIERRADRLFRAQWKERDGQVDTPEQRNADALAEIVDSSGATPTGKPRGPRTVVRLIVTKAAAERGWTEGDEKCETADGTAVPMAAVDDAFLDPDTKVQEVEFDETDVTTIKTYKKYIPQRIRDGLEAKGMVCCVPACGVTKGLQIDHTHERRDGGETSMRNSDWMCDPHHELKTRRLYIFWRDENGNGHWEPNPERFKKRE